MCGIVGMAGNLSFAEIGMFKDMLLTCSVRGMDSAGVCTVGMGNKDPAVVAKAVGHPGNLMLNTTMFDSKGKIDRIPKVIIGHTRAATFGEVNLENAHPFKYEHITGVHNGSLTHWKDLEGGVEEDVDSKALFRTIAAKGVDHTWKSFNGPAALVWWDDKEQELNFIRNKDRPLHLVMNKAKDAIFWASEPWMITIAAARHNIALDRSVNDETKVESLEIFQPLEDTLHVYRPTSMKITLEEVKTLEKKSYLVTPYQSGQTRTPGIGFKGSTYERKHQGYTPRFRQGKSNSAFPNAGAWAEGLEKADKAWVGRAFVLKYTVDIPLVSNTARAGSRFFVGAFTQEPFTRIEVYPQTTKEFEYWKGLIDADVKTSKYSQANIPCKLTCRPRIDESTAMVTIRVSADGVSYENPPTKKSEGVPVEPPIDEENSEDNIIYLPPSDHEKKYDWNGSWVTATTWMSLLKNKTKDSSCVWCGSPIQIEEIENVSWVGQKEVLCSSCTEDPDVKEELRLLTYHTYH
jgi:hypothetical protein